MQQSALALKLEFHIWTIQSKQIIMPQDIYIWLQENALWLQVAAAIAQAFAGATAIPVAFIAAYWSAGRNARQAFELSEKREKKKLDEQIALLRLLLGLEIQSNFEELRRFRNNFLMGIDHEETSEKFKERHNTDAEISGWLDSQQRFIALYLPDLNYRSWHSQQLSALLPVALTRIEIHQITFIYSSFDRLLKIKTMFGEVLRRQDEAFSQNPNEGIFKERKLPLSADELKNLLSEFDTILRDALDNANPLKEAMEEEKGEVYLIQREG